MSDCTIVCERCGMVVDNPFDLEYENDMLLCEFCRQGINPYRGWGPKAGFDLFGAGRVFGYDDYGTDINNVSDNVQRIGND